MIISKLKKTGPHPVYKNIFLEKPEGECQIEPTPPPPPLPRLLRIKRLI